MNKCPLITLLIFIGGPLQSSGYKTVFNNMILFVLTL